MDNAILNKAQEWLQAPFDPATREAVQAMIDNNPKELEESFYKNLEFGTGGLRGIMGAGTNRMNIYTVGMATQGLANYVKKAFPHLAQPKAAVSFDCRNLSDVFARKTAEVLAANGFKVYLFDALRPTPELSFAIRHLGCQTGVMVTASHNPKEYNGYKAYWDDGAQVTAPHDTAIIDEVVKVGVADVKTFTPGCGGEIVPIGREVDEVYLSSILGQINLSPEAVAAHHDIKLVYTPLHGCGVHLVPEALARMGFTQVLHVPAQDVNDGDFPTVKSPNPEEPGALVLAIEKAEAEGADVVLATDPDADRVGIAVRNLQGKMQLLNGNQTASLLTYYLLHRRAQTGRAQESDYIIKTIVTTNLMQEIAFGHGVGCYNVLTGFKHIATVVREQEGKRYFVGGGEESYGYNVGEFVRDKDAVVSCSLIAEAAAWAASQGLTLYQLLLRIYVEYGLFQEKMVSLTLKGKDGIAQMQAMMKAFRENPPQDLGGEAIVETYDYQRRVAKNLAEGTERAIELPVSNVLQFVGKDKTVVSVRPSGTEPKIKFYFSACAPLCCEARYEEVREALIARLDALISAFVPSV